tara:strand:- start:2780 stop:4384 length:1605 start_codon:yes stop_codon:yes gene_type:complete
MIRSDRVINYDNSTEWDKFSNLLWFNNELKIWLDISKVIFSNKQFNEINGKFENVFKAIDELENGAEANIDENRKVGHYWLRNPKIAPDNDISKNIEKEIASIKEFGTSINKGILNNKSGEKFTDVLWIGIGGSSLGPSLLIESLQKKGSGLNFTFIDNIDPFLINEKLEEIDKNLSTTLFVVVSKSGGTPEPKVAMDIIRKNIELKGINWCSQSIAITMPNSHLYKKALSEKWMKIFSLQDWVGGRTSITGSVGLLPLALINESIDDFLRGASLMDQLTRDRSMIDNPAALMASAWFFCGEGLGKRDMVVLPYRDRLQVFSKYLQQLVMESLGKKNNRSGEEVNQGISVFGNKGSTDQHAYVQQLRDGLDNFFCVFIELLDTPKNLKIFDADNPKDYLSGFLQGTRSALSKEDRQSITITINKLNSFSLGSLIALFERTVSFYAELININAYDQPGVEAGKKAASKVILLQKKVKSLLQSRRRYSFNEINESIKEGDKETFFFILRQLCFDNCDYIVTGTWSKPDTLIFQKLI